MDLEKIFECIYNDENQSVCYYKNDQYQIDLRVGYDGANNLSLPTVAINDSLSLNDYTHFAIDVFRDNSVMEPLTAIEMNNLFGFYFGASDNLKSSLNCPNCGDCIPEAYLIKILQKLGVIDDFPEDAGDGE